MMPFLPMRPRFVQLWEMFETTFGAMRIAGDVQLRSTIPSLSAACYLFCMWLYHYVSPLSNDAFDQRQHVLPLATDMSRVVVFLQSLLASSRDRSRDRSSPDRGRGSNATSFVDVDVPMVLQQLQPFLVNACDAVYTVLVDHHRRSPWIRNSSDVDATTREMLDIDRQLRREQNVDFVDALADDKLRVEKEQAALAHETKTAAALQEQEQRRHEELDRKRTWFVKEAERIVHMSSGGSGSNSESLTTQIRIRFPNGSARTLTLGKDNTLEKVFDFVDIVLHDAAGAAGVASFSLCSNYPKRSFLRDGNAATTTLESAGLYPRAVLMLGEN